MDALARLVLVARRLGVDVRIVHPPRELVELLDLAGLRVQVLGQSEGGEQAGVELEEVVEAHDLLR